MLTETEDRTFVTPTADLDGTSTSATREVVADEESVKDALRVMRRQDIADHGVLFR